jgi:hypothetical protein
MSIRSLWRNVRSDFNRNPRSGKLTAICDVPFPAGCAAATVVEVVGGNWLGASILAIGTIALAARARMNLRRRAARASAASSHDPP